MVHIKYVGRYIGILVYTCGFVAYMKLKRVSRYPITIMYLTTYVKEGGVSTYLYIVST